MVTYTRVYRTAKPRRVRKGTLITFVTRSVGEQDSSRLTADI